MTDFSLNRTLWRNLLFGAYAAYLFWVDRCHPMHHGDCSHHEGGDAHRGYDGHHVHQAAMPHHGS